MNLDSARTILAHTPDHHHHTNTAASADSTHPAVTTAPHYHSHIRAFHYPARTTSHRHPITKFNFDLLIARTIPALG